MKLKVLRVLAVIASAIAGFAIVSAVASGSVLDFSDDLDRTPSTDPKQVVVDAKARDAIPAAAKSSPPLGLSDDIKQWLREDGATIQVLDPAKTPTGFSLEDATIMAAGSFGFVNDGRCTGIVLARMTDTNFGRNLETDPSKPERIDPLIEDRVVWIIEFRGFTAYESGPLTPALEDEDLTPPWDDPQPQPKTGRMYVVVDSETGKTIRAIQRG